MSELISDPYDRAIADRGGGPGPEEGGPLENDQQDPAQRAAVVEILVALFVLVEGGGGCFDILVREAIERGEQMP